jgi:hypothetical protein
MLTMPDGTPEAFHNIIGAFICGEELDRAAIADKVMREPVTPSLADKQMIDPPGFTEWCDP